MKSSQNSRSVDIDKRIGQRAKEAIKRRGLTQKEVAAELSYAETSISDMLSGRKRITRDSIIKLSELLDVSTDYLLCLNDTPSKNPATPAISEYTGLSAGAIERLHSFKDPEIFKQFYAIMPLTDPSVAHYTKDRMMAMFEDDKLLLSLFEAKSLVWLNIFLEHDPLGLTLENHFRYYVCENVRKMKLDYAQKELLSILKDPNNSDTDQIQELYEDVLMRQQNCTGHIKLIKESIQKAFNDFCDWYYCLLDEEAEKGFREENKDLF